uniref:Uncharacterized protein n=1 Tax=Panagrolaimus davidi TaxID=227884 RepID=A0A914QJB2_9BILA
MLFNFTITLPFEGETTLSDHALSAEELSLWIREQTDYNEIDLRDNIDQRMPIDPLKYSEIVQLAVMSPTNTLMTILAIVLSTIFVLSSLCIGGLVFLKIRTDRLIEQHNRNIRTIQIDAASSSDIPLNVIPFESNGMVVDRHGMISEEMHEAADTVVFGRHGTTRVRHR